MRRWFTLMLMGVFMLAGNLSAQEATPTPDGDLVNLDHLMFLT
jgi:hypothetical protein